MSLTWYTGEQHISI